MASFRAIQSVNMRTAKELAILVDPDTGFGTDDKPQGFTAVLPPVRLVVDGQGFQYDGTHVPVAGTVNTIAVEVNDLPAYNMASLNVGLAGLIQALETQTILQVFAGLLSGADQIEGSPFADELYGFAGNDEILGGGGNDKLYGGAGNDVISGEAGNDQLYGGKGRDLVFGEAGNDRLHGNGGKDMIAGGPGKNVVFGGAGADTFHFTAKPDPAKNLTRIGDMKPGADTIALFSKVFKGMGKEGPLKDKYFHAGKKAADGNDHVIHHKSSGKIYYDKDGRGGADQVLFAKVKKGLNLQADDFSLFLAG